jgi:hypothetical protein
MPEGQKRDQKSFAWLKFKEPENFPTNQIAFSAIFWWQRVKCKQIQKRLQERTRKCFKCDKVGNIKANSRKVEKESTKKS